MSKNWWCKICGWYPHMEDGWTKPMPKEWVPHPCESNFMNKKIEGVAEAFAKEMIRARGTPHWHDLRDCYLAGIQWMQEYSATLAEAQAQVALLSYDLETDLDIKNLISGRHEAFVFIAQLIRTVEMVLGLTLLTDESPTRRTRSVFLDSEWSWMSEKKKRWVRVRVPGLLERF